MTLIFTYNIFKTLLQNILSEYPRRAQIVFLFSEIDVLLFDLTSYWEPFYECFT